MKTVAYKIKMTDDLQKVVSEDSRVYSSMVRFSFNRYKEGSSYKEVYGILAKTFQIGSHLRNCAARQASGIYNLNKDKKIVFGQFKRFQRGLISKDELKDSRDIGIWSEGEVPYRGNRLFQIDIENQKIIYKRSRNEHFDLEIAEKLNEKRRSLLQKIQILMQKKKIPVTFRLKKDKIYISYDEKIVEKEKQFKKPFQNRVLGIDLNPNYFGISILEFDRKDKFKIIYKEAIDLEKLQSCSKNKIHFELYEINHHILKLCKAWHVAKLAVEDLKFKKSNRFWSKEKNKLCRNQFRYSFVKSHLTTLCSVYGVELVEVNAAYSSIIGNFQHGSQSCPDMIAASIEIARRAYKKFQKGWIYPSYRISQQRYAEVLGNQWKKELELRYMSWKGLAGIIKESKLKYRFPLQPQEAVFRTRNNKKKIETLIFFNKI